MKNQKKSPFLLVRRLSRASRPRGRRGFSLVELMVVVLILAILAAIGTGILPAWQRQKLQSSSGDVRVLFQRAYSEVQRRGIPVFLQVGPLKTLGADKWLPIYLVGDLTGDEVLDPFSKAPAAGEDLLIDEYRIVAKGASGPDQEFALSVDNTSEIQSTLWSDNSLPWTTARFIMCDRQGRAMSVALVAGKPTSTGRQIGAPATLVFTHVNVARQLFQPPTRYLLCINPVWSVRVIKQIKDVSWVDRNG